MHADPLFDTIVVMNAQPQMLDPTWTAERGYSHADKLIEILRGGDKMATKKPTLEVVETEVKEPEANVIRPEMLAAELGVSGKQIRAFLRTEFTRPEDQKRSSWLLTEKQAEAVRLRFTPSEDDDEELEDV